MSNKGAIQKDQNTINYSYFISDMNGNFFFTEGKAKHKKFIARLRNQEMSKARTFFILPH